MFSWIVDFPGLVTVLEKGDQGVRPVLEEGQQAFLFLEIWLHIGVYNEMPESLLGLLKPGIAHFSKLVITKLLELVEVVHVVRLFDLSICSSNLGIASAFVLLLSILALSDVLCCWFSNWIAKWAIDLALPFSLVLEACRAPKRQRSLAFDWSKALPYADIALVSWMPMCWDRVQLWESLIRLQTRYFALIVRQAGAAFSWSRWIWAILITVRSPLEYWDPALGARLLPWRVLVQAVVALMILKYFWLWLM